MHRDYLIFVSFLELPLTNRGVCFHSVIQVSNERDKYFRFIVYKTRFSRDNSLHPSVKRIPNWLQFSSPTKRCSNNGLEAEFEEISRNIRELSIILCTVSRVDALIQRCRWVVVNAWSLLLQEEGLALIPLKFRECFVRIFLLGDFFPANFSRGSLEKWKIVLSLEKFNSRKVVNDEIWSRVDFSSYIIFPRDLLRRTTLILPLCFPLIDPFRGECVFNTYICFIVSFLRIWLRPIGSLLNPSTKTISLNEGETINDVIRPGAKKRGGEKLQLFSADDHFLGIDPGRGASVSEQFSWTLFYTARIVGC